MIYFPQFRWNTLFFRSILLGTLMIDFRTLTVFLNFKKFLKTYDFPLQLGDVEVRLGESHTQGGHIAG